MGGGGACVGGKGEGSLFDCVFIFGGGGTKMRPRMRPTGLHVIYNWVWSENTWPKDVCDERCGLGVFHRLRQHSSVH